MDINEVIATLKEDYELRKSLMRKKLSVQEELEDEIFDLEESYFTSWAVPKIEAYAKELLKDLECEINLAIIKDASGEVRVLDAGTPMPNPTDEYFPPDEPTLPLNAISGEIKTDKVKRPYNPEAELVVEFPDGTIYDDKKAIWTFVRAIEKIGFEKVAKVGIEIQGYNLVDKRQRTDKGRTWQKHVGPYYVYSYLSNGDKIKYLNRIATHYGLDLKIVAQ